MVASLNELFSFLTLALLLQLRFAGRLLHPYLTKLVAETHETYALFALQLMLAFYVAPALASLVEAAKDVPKPAVAVKAPGTPAAKSASTVSLPKPVSTKSVPRLHDITKHLSHGYHALTLNSFFLESC